MSAETEKKVINMPDIDTLEELKQKFDMFQTFVSRRFDEISMEINATSQQIDMNDESVSNRFSELLEILGAISYHGTGDTPANTGVELEAVIRVTEEAANKILDNADQVVITIEDTKIWEDKDSRSKALEKISNNIQEILMACAFQDLTGQRIRTTLENLKSVETRLSNTLSKLGIDAPMAVHEKDMHIEHNKSQDEIDALFD